LGERLVCNQVVSGSNPLTSTKIVGSKELEVRGKNEFFPVFAPSFSLLTTYGSDCSLTISYLQLRSKLKFMVKLPRANGGCLGARR
jgi:hypothetical protein